MATTTITNLETLNSLLRGEMSALETYRQAIAHDSYLEAAHRELMRCYAHLGERAQLQRHYRALAALLRDELGTTPDAETTALLDRLSRGIE